MRRPVRRTLTLKREALASLTTDELGTVHGAALPTSPLLYCLATLPVRTLDVRECAAVSDAPSCIDCATRAC